MRLIHTSDWHLGHTLHDHSRAVEHEAFLEWLLGGIELHNVDAVVITGDIFDTANPPASAQRQWYGFLMRLRARFPTVSVVVIGGNHDSAMRLDAPIPLLDSHNIHVVGGLARRDNGGLDLERLVVPLRNRAGEIRARIAAVPFLRTSDLPLIETGDPLIEGVRQVYADVVAEARSQRQPHEALIALGHCYMVGTAVSELSERRILGGNEHALPADIFAADITYAALGHLHRAQKVGSDRIRYAGSPIPLSMSEADYNHQAVLVELDGNTLVSTTVLPIPRAVALLRLPAGTTSVTIAELLPSLRALPAVSDANRDAWPFLEVHVRLDGPQPTLRREVDVALEGRQVRLVRLSLTYTGSSASLGDSLPGADLAQLSVEDVFRLAWAKRYSDPIEAEILGYFHQAVELAGAAE